MTHWSLCLVTVFRQTGPSKQCRPDQMPQIVASGQVYTACHSSRHALDTSTGSEMDLLNFRRNLVRSLGV